jgi:RNA polymerase sigma-70 factor (ECF subfamily)
MQIDRTASNVIAVDFQNPSAIHADMTLMELFARGNRSALDALFAQYSTQIYRYLLRLTQDQYVAEELLIEVFKEARRTVDRFKGRSQVSTWLLAIARSLAWSRMHSCQHEGPAVDWIKEPDGHWDGGTAPLQRTPDPIGLAGCLKRLTAAHRELTDLVYYHRKSIGEIAEITGLPLGTVKARVASARYEISTLLHELETNRQDAPEQRQCRTIPIG